MVTHDYMEPGHAHRKQITDTVDAERLSLAVEVA
jgi:hypothetical protein